MKSLCIIPCGSRKIWDKFPNAGPTKARDVYIGPFATICRRYAEKFYPNDWCILSAKYGFVFPDTLIPGPYNVTFNNKKTSPISLSELKDHRRGKGLDRFEEYIVIAGINYVSMIMEVFKYKKIITPLKDCKGMGYMMGKIKEALDTGILIK